MTRGKGEGSVYKRTSDGLWCVRIELPPGPGGKRRQKVVCRKSRADALAELKRLQLGKVDPEPMTIEQATEILLAAIHGNQESAWRGTSRRRFY